MQHTLSTVMHYRLTRMDLSDILSIDIFHHTGVQSYLGESELLLRRVLDHHGDHSQVRVRRFRVALIVLLLARVRRPVTGVLIRGESGCTASPGADRSEYRFLIRAG